MARLHNKTGPVRKGGFRKGNASPTMVLGPASDPLGLKRNLAPGLEDVVSGPEWELTVAALMLSPREEQILRQILVADASEVTIGEAIGISAHTVHTHLGRFYRKLAVSSRSQLVAHVLTQYALVVRR